MSGFFQPGATRPEFSHKDANKTHAYKHTHTQTNTHYTYIRDALEKTFLCIDTMHAHMAGSSALYANRPISISDS